MLVDLLAAGLQHVDSHLHNSMAACCSRQQLLLAALLLCASTTLSTVAGEHHDTAAPVYKILTIIPLGGSSHTFELVTMAGSLAKRCVVERQMGPCSH